MRTFRRLFVYDRGRIPFGIMAIVLGIFALVIPNAAWPDEYWRLAWHPVEFTGIIETNTPGGRWDLVGNANRATGKVEVKPGLRETLRDCVISHEKKHLAGYTHEERRGFAIDCGDGTLISQ